MLNLKKENNMEKITLFSFLQEMQSFVSISISHMALAEKSDINYVNNTKLAELSDSWVDGDYDEDPQLLVDELIRILD